VKMIRLMRQMVVLAMLVVLSAGGALAQRKDRDKRPPKEPVKVIENKKDKDNRPPPNSNRPKPDNRKRP